jgi:acyl-CoA thioester hydrolase
MSENTASPIPVFRKRFTVPAEAIDRNGHVNNVEYVQWMQDLAIQHWRTVGGDAVNEANNATWMARSHHIEYLRQAFEGDEMEAVTWVHDMRRVRSLRKYAFKRLSDGQVVARGETDWVFVSVGDGRPKAIPESVNEILPLSENPL